MEIFKNTEFVGGLPGIVDSFVGNILSYAVLLASIATITMTFLELIKAVFGLRLNYHRKKIVSWLKNEQAYHELLILSVAEVESADALFDQPTDKMLGQIQAATNVVIDFPDLYPAMYDFLTGVPRSEAARAETNQSDNNYNDQKSSQDRDIWANFITRAGTAPSDEATQAATKARARIDHFVSRKLDAFQTRTEYKWARLNQYWAVGGASILIFSFLRMLDPHPSPIIPAVFLALFGGMISPFAKDIITGLSSIKKS